MQTLAKPGVNYVPENFLKFEEAKTVKIRLNETTAYKIGNYGFFGNEMNASTWLKENAIPDDIYFDFFSYSINFRYDESQFARQCEMLNERNIGWECSNYNELSMQLHCTTAVRFQLSIDNIYCLFMANRNCWSGQMFSNVEIIYNFDNKSNISPISTLSLIHI